MITILTISLAIGTVIGIILACGSYDNRDKHSLFESLYVFMLAQLGIPISTMLVAGIWFYWNQFINNLFN